jgi:hypothetical protein
MKTRDLSKLTNTSEFQALTKDCLLCCFVKEGNLVLYNNMIVIYIYCYVTEDFPYFEIFSLPNSLYSNLSRIEYAIDSALIKEIYDYYRNNHYKSIVNEGIPGEVSMEVLFLAQVEILKKYFPNLLKGELEIYEKYFGPLKGGYKGMFSELKYSVEQHYKCCSERN